MFTLCACRLQHSQCEQNPDGGPDFARPRPSSTPPPVTSSRQGLERAPVFLSDSCFDGVRAHGGPIWTSAKTQGGSCRALRDKPSCRSGNCAGRCQGYPTNLPLIARGDFVSTVILMSRVVQGSDSANRTTGLRDRPANPEA